MAQEKYAILSENSDMVLCEAVLIDQRGSKITLKIVDDVTVLKGLKSAKFHKMQSYAEIYQGEIAEIKGDTVFFTEVVNISAQMRTEIKIKIHLETNVIKLFSPEEQKTPIAVPIVTNDISCGGIGFVSKASFDKEGSYEAVIPITSPPTVIGIAIMRKEFQPETNQYVYGSKFIDLDIVEERMLRKAIFKVQMRRHQRKIMEEKNK